MASLSGTFDFSSSILHYTYKKQFVSFLEYLCARTIMYVILHFIFCILWDLNVLNIQSKVSIKHDLFHKSPDAK